MRLPGFNAERALGASGRSYRSGGGAATGTGTARPAVNTRPPRTYQTRDVHNCTDCFGNNYQCALTESCARVCTTDGQGAAWCQPR